MITLVGNGRDSSDQGTANSEFINALQAFGGLGLALMHWLKDQPGLSANELSLRTGESIDRVAIVLARLYGCQAVGADEEGFICTDQGLEWTQNF